MYRKVVALLLTLGAIGLGPGAGAQPSQEATSQRAIWVAARAGAAAAYDTVVYRSTDGAEHWLRASNGLPRGIHGEVYLAADPSAPQIAYALIRGSGLYKTADGGQSWKRKARRSADTIALDPTRRQVVYLVGPGLLRSTDGGEHWRNLTSRACVYPPVERLNGRTLPNKGWHCTPASFGGAIVIDPHNAKVMYTTGTSVDATFLPMKSTDGGRTWRPTLSRSCWVRGVLADPRRQPPCFRDRRHIALGQAQAPAVDSRHRGVLYAAGDDGIYKTTDDGRTWVNVSPRRRVYILVVDPNHSNIVWAAAYTKGGESIVDKSTDGGRTWVTKTRVPSLYGVDFPSLAIDRHSPRTVYVTGRGVLKTSNGGATWAQKDAGLPREIADEWVRVWEWRWNRVRPATGWKVALNLDLPAGEHGPLRMTYSYFYVPCGNGPGFGAVNTNSPQIAVGPGGAFSYAGDALRVDRGSRMYPWPDGRLTLSGQLVSGELRGTVRVAGPTVGGPCAGQPNAGTQIDSGPQSFVTSCEYRPQLPNYCKQVLLGEVRAGSSSSFDLQLVRDVRKPGRALTLGNLNYTVPCGEGAPSLAITRDIKRFRSGMRIDVGPSGTFSYEGGGLAIQHGSAAPIPWAEGRLTLSGQLVSGELRGTVRVAGPAVGGPCAGQPNAGTQIDSGAQSFIARCTQNCGPPTIGPPPIIEALAVE